MKDRVALFAMTTAAVLAAVSVRSIRVAGQERQDPAEVRRLVLKETPRTADGKPDLRGRWEAPPLLSANILEEHAAGFGIQAAKSVIIDPPDGKFPYQPWALAERDVHRRPENAYLDNEGKCILPGVPRVMLFSFDMVYTKGAIMMFHEAGDLTRTIHMDRRQHLPDAFRLYMGDSVGHWEGDTLVADTANLNGRTWMGLGGDFLTDAARIVERFATIDPNTMKWTGTITDPKAFTRPFTMTTAAPLIRAQPGEWLEQACHEGNADLVHLKTMYDAAHAGDKK